MAGSPLDQSGGTTTGQPLEGEREPEPVLSVVLSEQLDRPSDLEFNPYAEDQLWVVNHGDSSVLVVANVGTGGLSVQRRLDPEAVRHFMPKPTALAFGGAETTVVDAQGIPVVGTFATCPEASQDFMGPTLWASDLRIFALPKSRREAPFNGADTGLEGPGSHLDMLHRTPNCTGIAWAGQGNVYWTYSGSRSMFVKYDFARDHGIGNTDHSDGSVWRYPVAGIRYVPDLPSHLALDPLTGRLYMVDPGHGRVVSFDPGSATGQRAMSDEDNVDKLRTAIDFQGGAVQDVVPSDFGLVLPSGLELYEGSLFVTDAGTSTVLKFALDGTPLRQFTLDDVQQGGLAGMTFGPDGDLYLADMADNRVLRLQHFR